jgi:hypothetical protein
MITMLVGMVAGTTLRSFLPCPCGAWDKGELAAVQAATQKRLGLNGRPREFGADVHTSAFFICALAIIAMTVM